MLLKTSKQEILELMFLLRLPQWSEIKGFSSRYGISNLRQYGLHPFGFCKAIVTFIYIKQYLLNLANSNKRVGNKSDESTC